MTVEPKAARSAPTSSQPHIATPAQRPLRSLLALLLLAIVGAVCFSLGLWQLDRAAERDALHAQIEHGRGQSPLMLSALTPQADFTPWRSAVAQGHWSDEHTVLLENRNLEGRPGYWVATPLLLAQPKAPSSRHNAVSAGSAELSAVTGHADASDFLGHGPATDNPAVLVLRGWLPRDLQAAGALPDIPLETGLVSVQGELHAHVPRIFELWQWAGGADSQLPNSLPQAGNAIAQVQNLELTEYARATGLRLLPTVLAQTQASVSTTASAPPAAENTLTAPPQTLRREWPGPSLDSDQNRGYALQWFSFSAIALIAALLIVRGMLRRNRQDASSKEAA